MPVVTLVPNPQAADGRPVVIDVDVEEIEEVIVESLANLPPPPTTGVYAPIVLQVAVAKFAPITADGFVADSNNPSTFRRFVGLALTPGLPGLPIPVGFNCVVSNGGWSWTKGDSVFLNGTGLSKVPPTTGYLQPIGTALSPTVLSVSPQTPIQL